jgi:hypothetical protein
MGGINDKYSTHFLPITLFHPFQMIVEKLPKLYTISVRNQEGW